MRISDWSSDVCSSDLDWLDGAARARIEGALGSLGWRCDMVAGWLSLLSRVGGPADPDFVDWLAIDRFEAREYDIGIHRHWLDPTRQVTEEIGRASCRASVCQSV